VLLEQIHAVLNEYRQHLPLTARQIFYRMVGVYDYPKNELAYERLCYLLGRARRAKLIPFWMLRDDGASVMAPVHYDGEEDFYAHVRRAAENYAQNKLTRQGVDIRVYCEAAGMMPQLKHVLEDYSIPVYSCSGYDSLSAKYDLKEWCHDTYCYRARQPVVLHLGDFDPSGESIYEVIRDDVRAFLESDIPHVDPGEFVFRRVALTPELIDDYQLPMSPAKASDTRSKRWAGETCQLEALPPDALASVLRAEIEEHWLDPDLLAADREKEETAQRSILRALPGGTA
jgi:hypothetical protein